MTDGFLRNTFLPAGSKQAIVNRHTITDPIRPHFFEAKYNLKQRVVIDGEMHGLVLALRFYTTEPEYLVGWFSNGESKSDWFSAWRVTASHDATW